jgi:hypothetical protein
MNKTIERFYLSQEKVSEYNRVYDFLVPFLINDVSDALRVGKLG